MIKNKKVAKHIGDLMVDFQARLNESLIMVQEECSKEEFEVYREALSYIMGYMLIKMMNPLYTANPEFTPEQLYIHGVSPKIVDS